MYFIYCIFKLETLNKNKILKNKHIYTCTQYWNWFFTWIPFFCVRNFWRVLTSHSHIKAFCWQVVVVVAVHRIRVQ